VKDALKPYPAYKDSAVPWLGNVPEHWDIVPNRATFKELKESGHPDEQMLSVTITQGVIQQTSLLRDTSKKDSSNEDRSKYKLVCPGDIAYNKMRAWEGALGVSQHRGIVSPAYIIVRPRGEQLAEYFHYLFRSPCFTKEAERWSYGISSDQWSLRPEEFRQIYCCVPPLPEQTAIVRYLNYIDRRIRGYIKAKKKLIALVNEQKQAIIQQAVTRGLDPNVCVKPSGVSWLGDVPEHWQVVPNRATFKELKESGHPDEQMLSVTITQGVIQQTSLLRDTSKRDSSNEDRSKYKLVYPGDIAYNKMRAWQGAVGSSDYRGIVSPAYIVMRPHRNQQPKYFHYLFRTPSFTKEAERSSYGITSDQWSLRPEEFKQIYSCVPPLPEQSAIVRYLDDATANIHVTIEGAKREIELLREYRTRLIADVVTGKLDAREAAASLPEEAEEEPEDIDALTENEGIPDEADLEPAIAEVADED